jgi:hypothetical protein
MSPCSAEDASATDEPAGASVVRMVNRSGVAALEALMDRIRMPQGLMAPLRVVLQRSFADWLIVAATWLVAHLVVMGNDPGEQGSTC